MPGSFVVKDKLVGKFSNAVACFHVHPDVRVGSGEHGLELTLPSGRVCRMGIHGGSAVVEPSTWHPEFGLSLPNQRVAVTFDGPVLETTFSY
jgi:hypothetical protein